VATYILNFVKAGTPHKQQLGAQARKLLELGLWGIPPTSPAKAKLRPGDRVIAYVGSPERVFIGDALIDQGYHSWTPDEAVRYPETGMYEAGISLRDVVIWDRPQRQQDIWPKLAAAQKNPGAMFMQTTFALLEADGGQLIQAGRGEVVKARPMPAPKSAPESLPSPLPSDPEAANFFAVVQELRELGTGIRINEETTRAFFLNKYFGALGYTTLRDIAHGEPAQSGHFPDYVLKVHGTPAIAVEAKALGSNLGTKEAGQVTGYCGTLGVRWGLLTDGRFFKLYDAHLLSTNIDDRLVFDLDLTDYQSAEDFDISIWSTVQMLSKQQMQTGQELERYAARELTRRILTDSNSATLKALREELSNQKINLSPTEVAALTAEVLGG
jgi:hypothetical protein